MTHATESTGNGRRAKSSRSESGECSGTFVKRRLGRYALEQELGRGTTGIVYEALDTRSNAVVALKTLASMDAENLFRLNTSFGRWRISNTKISCVSAS
jgi:serine/threonine protein kinase